MLRLVLVLLLGRSRVLRAFLSTAFCLGAGACVWIFHTVQAEAIGSHADSLAIQTPVKAHLRDGSTVLYRAGVLLAHDTLRGPGVRYGVMLRDSATVSVVPLDSVVAWALQSEGFSYTLGPAFELRDVDRLGVRPDRNGQIRLEVRNEALET